MAHSTLCCNGLAVSIGKTRPSGPAHNSSIIMPRPVLRWRCRGFSLGVELARGADRRHTDGECTWGVPMSKHGVSCLVLGLGLLTETSFALGAGTEPNACRTSDRYRAPIGCSENAATSPRCRAAVGRSDNRRARRCRRPSTHDSAKAANLQKGSACNNAPPCRACAARDPREEECALVDFGARGSRCAF